MASDKVIYRNLSSGDTKLGILGAYHNVFPDPTTAFTDIPSDYVFVHWNTAQDGTGVSFNIGETASNSYNMYYAIWRTGGTKMAEISKITLPSGTTYDLKDATAREAIAGGTSFLGVTTTELSDGSEVQTIVVGGKSISAINGGMAIYQSKEFVYSSSDGKWHEFGDTSDLGDLAFKDSATGNYTPAGSVSQPTFSGNAMTSTGEFTPAGTVSQPTFTGNEGNISVSGTPSGSISVGTGSANYTPGGTVSTPTITVNPSSSTGYVASSATGGGAVTAGTAASATMPVLTTSVANETLTISWTDGSFTANTPTAVTLPSFTSKTIVTGIASATSSQPSFTGDGVNLKFTGTSMSSTGKFTPGGTVSQPTFTGSEGSVSVSGTPSGTVSKPTFSGTQGVVEVS